MSYQSNNIANFFVPIDCIPTHVYDYNNKDRFIDCAKQRFKINMIAALTIMFIIYLIIMVFATTGKVMSTMIMFTILGGFLAWYFIGVGYFANRRFDEYMTRYEVQKMQNPSLTLNEFNNQERALRGAEMIADAAYRNRSTNTAVGVAAGIGIDRLFR